MQFRVDERFLKPGEKHWFLRYLALHTMHIDIWDSDTLLLLGSTAIELKVEDAVRLMAVGLASILNTVMQLDNRHSQRVFFVRMNCQAVAQIQSSIIHLGK